MGNRPRKVAGVGLVLAVAWAVLSPPARARADDRLLALLPSSRFDAFATALRVELAGRPLSLAVGVAPAGLDAGGALDAARGAGANEALWVDLSHGPLARPSVRLANLADGRSGRASLPAALDIVEPATFAVIAASLLDEAPPGDAQAPPRASPSAPPRSAAADAQPSQVDPQAGLHNGAPAAGASAAPATPRPRARAARSHSDAAPRARTARGPSARARSAHRAEHTAKLSIEPSIGYGALSHQQGSRGTVLATIAFGVRLRFPMVRLPNGYAPFSVSMHVAYAPRDGSVRLLLAPFGIGMSEWPGTHGWNFAMSASALVQVDSEGAGLGVAAHMTVTFLQVHRFTLSIHETFGIVGNLGGGWDGWIISDLAAGLSF